MLETDFIKAIVERPDDDAPRLIYSDWLEENGYSEKANFIRKNCNHECKYRCDLAQLLGIKALVGQTLIKIIRPKNNEFLKFVLNDGKKFTLEHIQDCCESVLIEDIIGDLNDLIGSPILMAEEITNSENKKDESFTWTFYKFATIKGYVTIRWYGTSNGHYSESVTFKQVN